MAELGDYLEQGGSRNEVTVEMLEYKFIDECEDPPLLRSVLAKLKSGEEGSFPHLERYTEDKLMSLLSEKERRKVISLRTGPTNSDIAEAGASLSAFIDKARADDQAILTRDAASGTKKSHETVAGSSSSSGDVDNARGRRELPPVRGQKVDKKKAAAARKEAAEAAAAAVAAQEPVVRSPSSHVYDAPNYFRKWDAYDVEAEEAKLEGLEEAEREAVVKANKAHVEKERQRGARRAAELAELRGKLSYASLSKLEREKFALVEKAKGNECFKAGEAEEAQHFYSRALALLDDNHPQAPVLWANRAMAALKLGLLEKAEEDCSVAIRLDPTYHKARLRRGMTLHKRGKYAQAVADFRHLLNVHSGIPDLDKLLDRSLQKLREVSGEQTNSSGVGGSGGSAAGIQEITSSSSTTTSVRIEVIDQAPPLLEEPQWVRKPFVDPPPPPLPREEKFTKVAISFGNDDDDDEDEEDSWDDEEGATEGVNEGMTRIAIAEDDDDDDDESSGEDGDNDDVAPQSGGGGGGGGETFQRVSIVEDDDNDDEDEDSEEEEQPIIEDVTEEDAKEKKGRSAAAATKVPIEESDDDDEDDEEEAAAGEDDDDGCLSEWDAEQLKKQGIKHFTAGKYAEAVETFERALGGLEASERKYNKSSNATTTSPFLDSNVWTALHNNLAACALAQQQWSFVVEHCDAVLDRASNEALKERKHRQQQQQQHQQHNAALPPPSPSPRNFKALLRRAEAREQLGLFGGALSDLRLCTVMEPDHPAVGKERLEKLQTAAATSAAAEVHKKKQQQQKAEIKPSSPTSASTSSSSSSSSAAKTADPAAAVAPPPSIVKTQDRTPSEACKVKGNEAMVQGNFSQAFSHYTDALSLQPSNVAARNNRCMCALKQGKWLEADSDASAVLALEPNNSKALFRRAHAREGLGLLEEARLDLRQALTCEPGNAKTQEALKGVEVKLSEEAKSRKELQRTQAEELERLAAQADVEAAEEARELKQKLLRAEGKAEAAKAKAKAKVAAEQAEKEAREEQEEQEKSSNGGEGGGEDADDAEARFLASLAGAAPADDEEDGEEEEGAMKNQGTRIMIEDEDESEDDDDEDVEDEDEENAEKGGSGVNNGGSNEDGDDDEEDDAAVYAQLNAQSSDDAKAQGNAFMAKGLFEKAAQLYTLALARDPANLAARNNRAASYLKLSNFERCAEDCSAVLTKEPENKKALARRAEALVGQSRQHSKHGNSSSRSNSESKSFLERALEDLAVLERLEPENPSTAARLEEIQTAFAALTPPPPSSSSPASPPSSSSPSPPSSSSSSPSSSSLLSMDAAATSAKAPKTIGGTVVTIVDEDEDSEDDTEVSVSPPLPPPPSPAAALSPPATAVDGAGGGGGGVREASDEAKALGNACLGQGDLSGAEAHYSKALGLDSTNSAARNNRSLCRLKRRDYAGAEKDATGVILTARSTDSAISTEAAALGVTKALLRRAQAREALGDLEMACKDLETVLESDPSHKEATTKLKAYEAKKRMQQQKKKTSSSSSSSSSTASAAGSGCGGGKGMGSGGTVSGGINSPSDLFNKKVEDARKAVAQDKAEAAKRPPLIVETSSSPSAPSSPSPASSSSPSSSLSSSSSDSSSPSSPPSPSSSLKVSQTKPSPSAAAKTSPKSPTTSAAAAKTSAAAAASSPVKVLKIKAKVPSEPPKTMYEFELKWRELKGSDADLAQYLKLFKVSTFKKVFKASTSPDIVPSLLRVATTQLSQNSSSSSRDLGACSRVLRGLAATAGFSMTRMLLSDDDKACVVQATDALSKSAKHAADAAEIRKAFL